MKIFGFLFNLIYLLQFLNYYLLYVGVKIVIDWQWAGVMDLGDLWWDHQQEMLLCMPCSYGQEKIPRAQFNADQHWDLFYLNKFAILSITASKQCQLYLAKHTPDPS